MTPKAITVETWQGRPDITVYLRRAKRDTKSGIHRSHQDRQGWLLPMYVIFDEAGEDARPLGRVYQVEQPSARGSYRKMWGWDTEPVDNPIEYRARWATREKTVQYMVSMMEAHNVLVIPR